VEGAPVDLNVGPVAGTQGSGIGVKADTRHGTVTTGADGVATFTIAASGSAGELLTLFASTTITSATSGNDIEFFSNDVTYTIQAAPQPTFTFSPAVSELLVGGVKTDNVAVTGCGVTRAAPGSSTQAPVAALEDASCGGKNITAAIDGVGGFVVSGETPAPPAMAASLTLVNSGGGSFSVTSDEVRRCLGCCPMHHQVWAAHDTPRCIAAHPLRTGWHLQHQRNP
jgi:hypothetical protein